LLGFYHSHPDHPARPSQYDLDHAWPTFAYIIVAVAQGKSEAMTVWYLKEDSSAFDEGELNGNSDSNSHDAPAVHLQERRGRGQRQHGRRTARRFDDEALGPEGASLQRPGQ